MKKARKNYDYRNDFNLNEFSFLRLAVYLYPLLIIINFIINLP